MCVCLSCGFALLYIYAFFLTHDTCVRVCVSLCARVPEERDLIHYRVSLEAHERESSLRVLKFILFLSAPIRLTNPSAACVQMIPEDSESTHQSYLRLLVHGVDSGRLHLKGLPQGSQKVLIQGKLQSRWVQWRDKSVLYIFLAPLVFLVRGKCLSNGSVK